ncbi:hypothetical protein [Mycobacterium sp. URHB0021]
MNPDDFFEEIESISPWTNSATTTTKLRRDLLNELRAGPVAGVDDLDAAIALTHLVWDDLIAFGTSGGNTLDDKEIALAQRALTAILARIGITLSFPWRDFSTFKAHWVRNGCYNSWQARRDLLNELFTPVQAELDRQEDAAFRVVNAEAVSPHTKTGWPKVDEELTELRRRFRTAATTQDYRDTGNRAVAAWRPSAARCTTPRCTCATGRPNCRPTRRNCASAVTSRTPWRARTMRRSEASW